MIVSDVDPALPSLEKEVKRDIKRAIRDGRIKQLLEIIQYGRHYVDFALNKILEYNLDYGFFLHLLDQDFIPLWIKLSLMINRNEINMAYGSLLMMNKKQLGKIVYITEAAFRNGTKEAILLIHKFNLYRHRYAARGAIIRACRDKSNYGDVFSLLSFELDITEMICIACKYKDEELAIQLFNKMVTKSHKVNFNLILQWALKRKMPHLVKMLTRHSISLDLGIVASLGYAYFEAIPLFIELGAKNWNSYMFEVGRAGSLSLVEFFMKKGATFIDLALYGAIVGGRLNLCKNLIERGAKPSSTCFYFAIKSDNATMIEFFSHCGTPLQIEKYTKEAMRRGFVETIMAIGRGLASECQLDSFDEIKIEDVKP